MEWTPLFRSADLAPGTLRAHGPVLVVRTADGALHAMENACPHQAYPLAQGQLAGDTLTCVWHNWKFDVRTGACALGEEGVAVHPVREHEGMIEVHRSVHIDAAASWRSLAEAMTRVQTGRIAREVARLRAAGVPRAELMAWGVGWDADHAEYGLSHAAALAAELLVWDAPPEGRSAREHDVQRITEVLDLAARAAIGLPRRERPPAEAPGPEAAAELRRRIEAEAAPEAEALARGLVAAGWSPAQWEAALYPCLADHFLDFGHALIYLERVLAVATATPTHADAVLGGYVRGLAQGTREDMLPPWAGFRARLATWSAGGGLARAGSAPRVAVDPAPIVAAVLDGTPAGAFAAVAGALEAGAFDAVGDALVRAGATRLWRFDARHDANPEVEEGWLDITHRFTAACAARRALGHAAPADAARIALATAQFIRLARPLDGPEPTPSPLPPDAELRAAVLAGSRGRGVFWAHDVKVLAAALAERDRLGDDLPLQAAVRYLRAPVRERATQRLAVEAVRLVDQGAPPKSVG